MNGNCCSSYYVLLELPEQEQNRILYKHTDINISHTIVVFHTFIRIAKKICQTIFLSLMERSLTSYMNLYFVTKTRGSHTHTL